MTTFQILVTAIQMIATVVLARLLAPSDFGVVAMVTTFSLLFQNFGLNGITEAAVQKKDLNAPLTTNLFWISVGSGLLLTVIFAMSGSLLARFYHEPRVGQVAIAVSTTIFLTSVSVLHLALLKKAMYFTKIAANDVAARIVSTSTSIILGIGGWNYWSLVAGTIAQALSTSVGAWILCQWLPGRPRRVAGTGSMVRFGINVYGFFGLNYIKANIDNLLVGWNFGSNILGFYKKAFDLFYLTGSQLFGPIASVALPTLSRLNDEPERYRRYILRSFSILALAGMGLGACLTIVGKDVILVLLGPKWDEAGRIFALFGPGIGAMFLYAPWGWMLLSTGKAGKYLRWGILEMTVTTVLFFLALPWGPKGIATAWSISYWLLVFPATWYACRASSIEIRPIVQVVWKYLLASVLSACTCFAIIGQVHALFPLAGTVASIIRTVTVSFTFGSLYIAAVVLLHRGWMPIYQITRILPALRPAAIHSPTSNTNRVANYSRTAEVATEL